MISHADNSGTNNLAGRGLYHVYVGTYTDATSRGIYRFGLNAETGVTTEIELVAELENPSFLAADPTGRTLIAVSEVAQFAGESSGGVCSFTVEASTGKLRPVSRELSGGLGPCHLNASPDGRLVAVANYQNGSIALLPVDGEGRLAPATGVVQHSGSSVNPLRQAGPHAHSANFDQSGKWVLAADLGLDKVISYPVDKNATGLEKSQDLIAAGEATVEPGSGPRSLAWHPNGLLAYVIGEMGNTVTVFGYDAATGALDEKQTVTTLPDGWTGESYGGEVMVHPGGAWVYASNRGHDSLSVFDVDPASGKLTLRKHVPVGGKFPRHFSIDPTGRWLVAANQNSDNIVLFRVNTQNGQLDQATELSGISQPACILFVPQELNQEPGPV